MKKNKIFCILGIICGLGICIMGFIAAENFWGHYPNVYKRYGADFYTDIYQATASAAVNIERLGCAVSEAFGFLLVAIGLTDICYFGLKFPKKETINVCDNAETTKSEDPVETTTEETTTEETQEAIE